MDTPKRHRLLMIIQNDYVARDFIGSGVLEYLKGLFEIWFVIGPRIEVNIEQYGKVVAHHSVGRWRSKIWEIAFGLRHLSMLDPLINTQRDRLNSFQRGRSKSTKHLVFALHRLGASGVVSLILERFLYWTARDSLKLSEFPDVALLPTGINDLIWDDTVSYCRSYGVPSLSVTINWDNIAHKAFLQKPDLLGVWGEQGYLFARLFQRIPAKNIVTVGSPRFENYHRIFVEKDEARFKLALPNDKKIIMFAGAGVVFDEVSLIEEFEGACRKGILPPNLLMVYKPHPKRHKRAAEPALRPNEYHFVRVWQETELTPLEKYPVLLAAMDAMVSPFSTMLMEGALMGLPALGLAYDDPKHGDYSWTNARMNSHLHPMLNSQWVVQCYSRERFLESLIKLLTMVDNTHAKKAAQQASRFILYDGDQNYACRIAKELSKLISESKDKG